MITLLEFLSHFRFLKKRRERLEAAELRIAATATAERAHQLAMLDRVTSMVESLVDSQAKQAAEQSAALIEIAKANQAQATSFSDWMKSFQTVDAPTTSVVREEDELAAEQSRLLEEFGLQPDETIPEEFKLALRLQKGILDFGADAPN